MATRRWIAMLVTAVLAAGDTAALAGGVRTAGPDEAAVVNANTQFGFDLYARLRVRDGNACFSPYSISSVLAMTYPGARGATATQMAGTLRFPFEGDRLHRAFAQVTRDVNGAGSKGRAELAVANSLWTQTGLPMLPDFLQTVKTRYGASVTPVDFMRAPERARITINGWVEQQTRDRIKDLLPEGTIHKDTRLVLTNAIYFKGTWKSAFPESATRKDTFVLSTGRPVPDVPLMNQQGRFRYLDGVTFQVLELPYDADEQSMFVFLPKRADGLSDFERMLTAARMSDWVGRMAPHDVHVTLPRFKVTATFSLKDALTDMGMRLAFSPDADFSGITTAGPLSIDAVVHKAYVDVYEKGTEAAAASAATVRTLSLGGPEPVVFRADHPFFFVIRDNHTGSLLFAGRVVDPQGK